MDRIGGLIRDRRGAVAVEYGLILALIFLAMIGAVVGFGRQVITMWDDVSENVQSAR
jgi:pilus assembly protein Flp/PilA